MWYSPIHDAQQRNCKFVIVKALQIMLICKTQTYRLYRTQSNKYFSCKTQKLLLEFKEKNHCCVCRILFCVF